MSRRLVLLLLAATAVFSSFYLLLSVVPLYVTEAGGGSSGAGLATATLMLTTVLTQVQMPPIISRLGYRVTFAAGLLLLGMPAFFYPLADGLVPILLVTLVRGVGFGITTVVPVALVAELVPPERRGQGIGLYGLAAALPTTFGLPLGVWLVGYAGYPMVFLIGALAPLLGVLAVPGIRVPRPEEQSGGFFASLRRPALRRPFLIFAAATVASGVIVTFLPLSAGGAAAAALLIVGLSTTAARWLAGWFVDRYGSRRLLAPGLILAALGMFALGWAEGTLLPGALLWGTGFGLLQNVTMVLLVERVPRAGYGTASTLWNVAFDAGTGTGGFVFGFFIGLAGFSAAYAVAGALLLATLSLVVLDRPERAESKAGTR